ncbi:hypothetical protein [Kocuria rhizosphaericola]|uniref:hypothetical protein n=1 Tax=Kocuria rhizosphaericola TaxID=3376284 RepID=UPI0037944735
MLEASSVGPLLIGASHDILHADAHCHGDGSEHFVHIGSFFQTIARLGGAEFFSFFEQLGRQGAKGLFLAQLPSDWLTPVFADEVRDQVADKFAHDVSSFVFTSVMEFYRVEPTPVTSWRMAVLMGANSRTYKFAFGAALLELAKAGREEITIEELAVPYAWRLAQHVAQYPQGPMAAAGGAKDFLKILANERQATLDTGRPTDRLVAAAVDSMPGMVMQKFHNLRGVGQVEHSFYELRGRAASRQVILRPELHGVARHELLEEELIARWSIVETAFDAGIGRGLLGSGLMLSDDGDQLVTVARKFSRCLRPAGVRRLRVLRPLVG